jgi:nucleoside-diphosphate-sugar epimerase
MPALICFGLGYCAQHFIDAFGHNYARVVGTVRGEERAAALRARFAGRVQVLPFDGQVAGAEVAGAIAESDHALVSIPQTEQGDPVLMVFGDTLERARLQSVVYLSTVGVYGDRGGGWVDEETPVHPVSVRASRRLEAERSWQRCGERSRAAVAVLRLAGIYGSQRNAFVQIASGKARRVVKAGQVFNHVHVADIAQAIDAAVTRNASGIFNVADDEPSPPGDPISFAAKLMGVAPPPEIPFEQAAPSMSPLALSFWQECRRVRNEKLKSVLGVRLRYPTYREGLRALAAEGELAR